jgi:RimJ/RimL family protein N-acetyltransferase
MVKQQSMHHLVAGQYLLRPLTHEDVPAVATAVRESTDTVGKWMPWATSTYSNTDAEAWIKACHEHRSTGEAHEYGVFVEGTREFVGADGLNQFNTLHNFCNLGYWTRQSAQRRGAAGAAVAALSRFAFAQLKLNRLEIVVLVGNDPSAAVARRAGAALECTARNRLQFHGEPRDAYVYSLIPAGA